jgi:hypothetical protein
MRFLQMFSAKRRKITVRRESTLRRDEVSQPDEPANKEAVIRTPRIRSKKVFETSN